MGREYKGGMGRVRVCKIFKCGGDEEWYLVIPGLLYYH